MAGTDFTFNNLPRAFFITFRCHGTWLHGDRRGSMDRNHDFGTPRLAPNERRQKLNLSRLKNAPIRLSVGARALVEAAIKETCMKRHWELWIVNARTNHVHVVVSADCDPERVIVAFMANATRKLREAFAYVVSVIVVPPTAIRKNRILLNAYLRVKFRLLSPEVV